MIRTFIGVDPGKSGGIAAINSSGEFIDAIPMPIVGDQVDVPAFIDFVKSAGDKTTIIIEEVHSMPGQGVASMFTFGRLYGTIIGASQALGVQIRFVKPKAWQIATCGKTNGNKEVALEFAMMQFPEWDRGKNKQKASGMADALCIAEWGRRN